MRKMFSVHCTLLHDGAVFLQITSRAASKTYLLIIDNSDLGGSNEVDKLMGRVESTFVKYFSSGNRRKGVKLLRPRNKVERHRTTFTLGILTGCSVALVVSVIVTIHARGLIQHEGGEQYMNIMFPLYRYYFSTSEIIEWIPRDYETLNQWPYMCSLFVFIFLHMFMYGINTYLWRRFRVNYPFIFGLKSGTELGFREIFLLASALSVLTLAAVLSNLDMEMDPRTQRYQTLTELVPAGLVMVLLLITFCPFNIIYRSSRFFLIRCTWHCLLAPFYKVTFSDFFLADQLTSQVQAFRSVQFYICYYGWGDFKRRSNQCLESKVKGTFWKIVAASSSGVTTIFNTYWDIVMDWGLLRKKARNPWLRDKLLISNKAVYFVAMIVNILLRLVWMQLVLDFDEAPFLHRRVVITLVACLEILRRGIWNFFRLENEHFNNVEKYRAIKLSPLPFYYDDQKCL
ncbi:phosphate transporter PHO1 homolog 9-like isoform X3 [Henckelia pumila]|uniref:phosphate transporter PHO1 homolog 9-like isoform X3 n=1 Tax=Henckelia pumila TaxID=405737 RepID=UPI003C6E8525